MNPVFARYGHADIRRLISQYPLAWAISPGAPASSASLLPLLSEHALDGSLVRLVGHMARSNPLVALFAESPVAHFLFTGPQGYISPDHAGKRDWAPTWNYAALRIEAEVRVSADLTAQAVDRLVGACEEGRGQPWTVSEMSDRYPGMLQAIVGFEARVTALDATFKLAQDETDEVLRNIVSAHPDKALSDWMRSMNTERLA